VDHVYGAGVEREKGDEIVGVGAGVSSCGKEEKAAPERIHGIRFAGMGRKAKKKKGLAAKVPNPYGLLSSTGGEGEDHVGSWSNAGAK
jgi:hypothetical protein